MNSTLNRRQFLTRVAAVTALHSFAFETPLAQAQDLAGDGLRLRRIHLKAPDLELQAAFYRDVLRLPVDATDERVVVTAGFSEIEFTQAASGVTPFYHFAFMIPENQLAKGMAWLEPRCPIANIKSSKRKTIQFRNWDAEAFYFFDPAGNILEFIAHHPLENGTDEPFSEEQILQVCEIGLVVPDVTQTVELVGSSLGIHPYISSSGNFAPIGDVQGLLIVVPQDRVWLPTTDVRADVFETDVEAEGLKGDLIWDGLPYRVTRFS